MKNSLGVIVGRFQVAELHKGHKKLIDTAVKQNDHVIIFLGVTSTNLTKRDPLSFNHRKAMINEAYPFVQVIAMIDMPGTDQEWVDVLDSLINISAIEYVDTALYGSRDSFIDTYVLHGGKHKVYSVIEEPDYSGTQYRAEVCGIFNSSVEMRKGIIYTVNKLL